MPTRSIRSLVGSKVRRAGKARMSSVGVSTISPLGFWSQANTLTWKRDGSGLSFFSVSVILRVCADRRTWTGLTVKTMAEETPVSPATQATATAIPHESMSDLPLPEIFCNTLEIKTLQLFFQLN